MCNKFALHIPRPVSGFWCSGGVRPAGEGMNPTLAAKDAGSNIKLQWGKNANNKKLVWGKNANNKE